MVGVPNVVACECTYGAIKKESPYIYTENCIIKRQEVNKTGLYISFSIFKTFI